MASSILPKPLKQAPFKYKYSHHKLALRKGGTTKNSFAGRRKSNALWKISQNFMKKVRTFGIHELRHSSKSSAKLLPTSWTSFLIGTFEPCEKPMRHKQTSSLESQKMADRQNVQDVVIFSYKPNTFCVISESIAWEENHKHWPSKNTAWDLYVFVFVSVRF